MRDDTRRRLVSRQNVSAGNQIETAIEGEREGEREKAIERDVKGPRTAIVRRVRSPQNI